MNGSIIICDHVYETKDGKFVISGTYNQWWCTGQVLKIPQIHCYIRIYPERTGTLDAAIVLRDDNLPPDQPPIMNIDLQLEVLPEHIPVMEFAVRSNVAAEMTAHFDDDSASGARYSIPLSLALLAEGEIVATSPLKVVFSRP